MSQLRLCLTGDVMTGRGVDQILAHPGDPAIHEPWLTSAQDYVALAEAQSGPIPRRVAPTYVWGEVLHDLAKERVDACVVNLETAVTERGRPWPGKGIQYRMHPANVGCLSAAGIDVAVLANNHVLDWSVPGLEQTIDSLHAAGIATVGAGRTRDQAWRPARVETAAGSRVVVVAVGAASSGIPSNWAAGAARPGVARVGHLSDQEVQRIATLVADDAGPGDVVVASLHWGGNWGYPIPPEHRRFAHALVERAGVHVVHGHSSHHPLGIEVHAGGLILYGCGDLLTDYEGITGHEQYRGDLGAFYLPTIEVDTGALVSLTLLPTQVRRFQLVRPEPHDVEWLAGTLTREGAALGTSVDITATGRLELRW